MEVVIFHFLMWVSWEGVGGVENIVLAGWLAGLCLFLYREEKVEVSCLLCRTTG